MVELHVTAELPFAQCAAHLPHLLVCFASVTSCGTTDVHVAQAPFFLVLCTLTCMSRVVCPYHRHASLMHQVHNAA